MPDILEVINSVQTPQLIKDSFIAQGNPLLDSRGRPEHYVGGFAAVFPFNVKGEKWAFRCWTADLGNMENRLKLLADELSKSKLPYFTDFVYTLNGLVVDGKVYPTTRMRWIEGQNLKQYICSNKTNSKKLEQLADDFLEMCNTLHQHHISHGDLQHGNILVDKSGKLRLIDYDSVYVPALKGENDIIAGSPGYQHPARKDNHQADEKVDYFSELVIYFSIIAILEDPSLVSDFNVKDSDWLLFSPDCFSNFESSEIAHRLAGKSERIDQLLSIMKEYLSHRSILELEPFDDVLDRMQVSFSISPTKIRKGKEKAMLQWEIKKADSITLFANGSKVQRCNTIDNLKVTPNEDTIYRLEVLFKNGKSLSREVKLIVREECSTVFLTDREYTFRGIPFSLQWEVKNANKVELLGSQVDMRGTRCIADGVEEETTYSLHVTDEFGEKTFTTTIRILPIPVIKTLMTPAPDFSSRLSVSSIMPIKLMEMRTSQPILPSIEYDDILKRVSQIPQSITPPSFVMPEFELPKSFPKKVEESITSFSENITHQIETIVNKLLNKQQPSS